MTAHIENLKHLTSLLEKQKPRYECAACWHWFPFDEIKALARYDEGVWFNIQLCPDCAKEFLRNGEWRE